MNTVTRNSGGMPRFDTENPDKEIADIYKQAQKKALFRAAFKTIGAVAVVVGLPTYLLTKNAEADKQKRISEMNGTFKNNKENIIVTDKPTAIIYTNPKTNTLDKLYLEPADNQKTNQPKL